MPDATVTVSAGEGREYQVLIGADALGAAGEFIRRRMPSRVAIVADENAADLHLRSLSEAIGDAPLPEVVFVPPGESSKSIDSYELLLSALLDAGLRRDSLVVAFGGGVVGDLAGFAAATYMRGIDFCQIPTTLLAQVDAAVGGKTGINHSAGKNLIGAVWQPRAVFCDPRLLSTLPDREYLSGLAEVVKCGLAFDERFFSWLEERTADLVKRDVSALLEAVRRAVEHKARVVEKDERDLSGERALLNLGHTFAHAIERAQRYDGMLHGEAVSVGLVAAAELSAIKLGLAPADAARIRGSLGALGLPTSFPPETEGKILGSMGSDKKFDSGGNKFVLLGRIGEAQLDATVKPEQVERAIAAVGFGE